MLMSESVIIFLREILSRRWLTSSLKNYALDNTKLQSIFNATNLGQEVLDFCLAEGIIDYIDESYTFSDNEKKQRRVYFLVENNLLDAWYETFIAVNSNYFDNINLIEKKRPYILDLTDKFGNRKEVLLEIEPEDTKIINRENKVNVPVISFFPNGNNYHYKRWSWSETIIIKSDMTRAFYRDFISFVQSEKLRDLFAFDFYEPELKHQILQAISAYFKNNGFIEENIVGIKEIFLVNGLDYNSAKMCFSSGEDRIVLCYCNRHSLPHFHTFDGNILSSKASIAEIIGKLVNHLDRKYAEYSHLKHQLHLIDWPTRIWTVINGLILFITTYFSTVAKKFLNPILSQYAQIIVGIVFFAMALYIVSFIFFLCWLFIPWFKNKFFKWDT